MHLQGKILALFESHKGESKRVEKSVLILDENGVQNDKFYAKDRERSVLISSTESYALAEESGIALAHGELGENIILDFNPYTLPIGTYLEIDEVVLQISQNCTLCKSLTKVDSRLPKLLKKDRGIFAKVIKSGVVSVGTEVNIGG